MCTDFVGYYYKPSYLFFFPFSVRRPVDLLFVTYIISAYCIGEWLFVKQLFFIKVPLYKQTVDFTNKEYVALINVTETDLFYMMYQVWGIKNLNLFEGKCFCNTI